MIFVKDKFKFSRNYGMRFGGEFWIYIIGELRLKLAILWL